MQVGIARVIVVVPVAGNANQPEQQVGYGVELLQRRSRRRHRPPGGFRHPGQVGPHAVDVHIGVIGGGNQQRPQGQVEAAADGIGVARYQETAQL